MNKSATATRPWSGRLVVGRMYALYAGNGGETFEHLHPAHKILIGGAPVIDGKQVGAGRLPVAVPAGVRHRVAAGDGPLVAVYLDARRYSWHDATACARRWRSLRSPADRTPDLLEDIDCWRARVVDDRAASAVAMLATGMGVREVAHGIGLSESRVTHLVGAQFGAPPSTWRRWLRLRDAVDRVAAGASVTEAAHAAGFADSSHMSRTCRTTLGLPPSALASMTINDNRPADACG